jgi:putative transcriptional regulator
MVEVLDKKRSATKFRVLVEIADRQPAVNQTEIAGAVGVTSQAVSEYIRELVADGYVDKEARSRYRVTKEGVDWLFQQAADVRRFAEHVTEDVLGSMQEDAAIATAPIGEGDVVTLSIKRGLLHAGPGDDGPATGVATTAADTGGIVGVTEFEGIIEMEPGDVTVFQVPSVRSGATSTSERLTTACQQAGLVAVAGVEAVVTCRISNVEVNIQFAAGAVAADAAGRGVDVVVVASTDTEGRVTSALRDAGLAYEVHAL